MRWDEREALGIGGVAPRRGHSSSRGYLPVSRLGVIVATDQPPSVLRRKDGHLRVEWDEVALPSVHRGGEHWTVRYADGAHRNDLAALDKWGDQQAGKHYLVAGEVEGDFDEMDALREFTRLAQEPQSLEAFLALWGPLDICPHGQPFWHHCRRIALETDGDWILERAAVAAALLAFTNALVYGERPGRDLREHWLRLRPWTDPKERPLTMSNLRVVAPRVIHDVWGPWTALGARVQYSKSGPELVTDMPGIWGAIGRQLVFFDLSDSKRYVCSRCGAPVFRERRVRPGARMWCDECKKLGRHWVEYKRAERAAARGT